MTSAEARKDFVLQNAQLAVDVSAGTPIFPETVLTLAIYESSAEVAGVWIPGASKLSREANNFFGMKAGSKWTGATYDIKTTEYVWVGFPPRKEPVEESAKFRKYATKADSFKDFVAVLQSVKQYADNGVLTAKTVSEQITAIGKAGYATNPSYATTANQIYAAMKTDISNALADKEKRESRSGAGVLATIAAIGIGFYFLTK